MNIESTVQSAQRSLYEIQFRGRISQRWADWLGDLTITSEVVVRDETVSTAAVEVADQGALLGTLQKMHNLGFSLLQIKQMDESWPDKRSTG